MSAQLDFPPIAEATPVLAVVASAQPTTPDLAKIDLKAVALAQFGDWRTETEAATKKLTGVVLDLTTQSKVDEAKSLRQRTVNTPIAEVRKVSKALKSKLASVSKDIGAEEEAAVAAWTAVGELMTPQIERREAELAAERAVKAQGEAFRKALHLALIERIKGYVDQATGLPSERIAAGVTFVQGLAFGDECQDFLPQYRTAHAAALATLITMRDDAKAREDAEAQRLENERVAAELAAQRAALEAEAAELKRQAAEVEAARLTAEATRTQAENGQAAAERESLVSVDTVARPVFGQSEDFGIAVLDAAVPDHAQTERTTLAQTQAEIVKGTELACGIPLETERAMDEARAVMASTSDVRTAPMGLPATSEPATLKLGTIGERLGFTLTEAFVSEVLGIQPSGKEKRAVMFKESDFPRICDALSRHVLKAKAGELLAA